MDDADRTVVLDHEQAGDRALVADPVHDAERLGGQRLGPDGPRRAGHDLARRHRKQARVHVPAQVAVGDDADQGAAVVGDADAAESPLGHDQDRLGHGGVRSAQRHGLRTVHDVGDMEQLAGQGAAGVQDLEVLRRKPFAFEQGDGDGVAERQHHGGRGGRRQAHGTGLRRPRQQQGHIGAVGQRRARLGGHGHQRDAETAGI